MAGIGFALRKILANDNYFSTFRAYGYAGIISSGPWILSIIGILILGLLTLEGSAANVFVSQFQVTVTYLIASSLILSGMLQHSFTRYIADQLFSKNDAKLIPNLHGVMLINSLVAGSFAWIFCLVFMQDQSLAFKLLCIANFVILCNQWVCTNLLTGLKTYKLIVGLFTLAYVIIIVVGLQLQVYGLNGLLTAFLIGHVILLVGMMITLYYFYPTHRFIEFDFASIKKTHLSLVFSGVFYNLGVWIDKFIFWYNPLTGHHVIGPFHASIIYDLPIFLAYLAIIPGMAVFLVRMETDFVEYYDKFYQAVRDGGTLIDIRAMRNEMVVTAKQGIYEIIKIQGLAVMLVFAAGPWLLRLLKTSPLYLHLLYIDVVGASLQVVFLGLLNIFFYLDKRRNAMLVTGFFVVFNGVLSQLSIHLGAFFFGYGYAVSLLLTIALSMMLLDHDFETLEYKTFMLQS